MKRLCFLLAALLVFTAFTGCQKKATDYTMLVEIYAGKAQEYIDSGDTDSAIAILNEGIAATENAEKLTDMLDRLSQPESQRVCPNCGIQPPADSKFCTTCGTDLSQGGNLSSSFDLTPYYGTWAEQDIGWTFGGMILELKKDGKDLQIDLSYTQSAPASRVAEVCTSIPLADIQGNTIIVQAENDGWGHTADIKLTLDGDNISCTVSNVVLACPDGVEAWGLLDGDFLLVRNDAAHEAMQYTQEMYEEAFSDDAGIETQLADGTSLNTPNGLLTVSEKSIYMQDSAVLYVSISYIGSVSWSCDSSIISMQWGEWETSNTLPLYITGLQNGNAVLRISDTDYPNDYIEVNVCVSGLSTVDTSKASGILASLGMTEDEFRASCQRLLSSNVQLAQTTGTELYYSDVVKYPNNYMDKHFVIDNVSEYSYDFLCSYKGTSDDGYLYYEDTDYYDYNAVIYDFRDDPYSPNIVQDDDFTPYVIFKGVRTISGEEWLVFWMISVDMQ